MPVKLARNNYGKSRVRLVRVTRINGVHHLKDVSVDIQLEGDFEAVHTRGDNSNVLPTDTMKNTVYVLAQQRPVGAIEEFGQRLVRHFLQNSSQLSAARIAITENLWARIAANNEPHPWAFVSSGREKRTANVSGDRKQMSIEAGIDDLLILKSGDSAFDGYIRDPYTTLKETRDRIFATVLKASWSYIRDDLDFGCCWSSVRDTILTTFADHKSESVQHTMFAIGQSVLNGFADISEIRLSMPNKHHLLIDLAPFGLENHNEVFVPTEEPHGLIEAVLRRD
jgi:urate oxidase